MEQDVSALFKKLMNNECSAEEVDRLLSLLSDPAYEPESKKLIEDQLSQNIKDYQSTEELRKRLDRRLKLIVGEPEPNRTNKNIRKLSFTGLMRLAVAASLLAVLSVGLYLYFFKRAQPQLSAQHHTLTNDIAPGTNKAVLTLGNGKTIILTGAGNGVLANQGKTAIQKTSDGMVVYDASKNADVNQVTYNTITTPRGGQYQVVLPDGSKIWLNASSSLRFPTAFTGKERLVELSGEAYFEVAKNRDMPFKVSSMGQVVQVLGTHFNINAYSNEPAVKTTLLEGSIQLAKGKSVSLLKPGQQALTYSNADDIYLNPYVNVDEAVAWKNGMFQFNDADITTIMRQVSRWYDVDVEIEDSMASDHFRGKISRNVNVSQVLKILEQSGIKFKIEGRKIIVRS